MESDPTIEFSRIISFDQIGSSGSHYHVEAKEEERRLLATRFQLIEIYHLSAEYDLSEADEPGCYRVQGEVVGDVVQTCVSSLQDVPGHIKAKVNMLLRPCQSENNEEEFVIDLEDERDIEYYSQESIDLGETTAQYLYLNLDPFPRAPNSPEFPDTPAKEVLSPMAQALKDLKKK